MSFGALKIFNSTHKQLDWLAQRQRVLSQNIANATTPGYRARDLQTPRFPEIKTNMAGQKIALRPPEHDSTLQKGLLSGSTQSYFIHSDEQKLSGNNVVPEREMEEVNKTAILHQQVISVYKQHLTNLMSIF